MRRRGALRPQALEQDASHYLLFALVGVRLHGFEMFARFPGLLCLSHTCINHSQVVPAFRKVGREANRLIEVGQSQLQLVLMLMDLP